MAFIRNNELAMLVRTKNFLEGIKDTMSDGELNDLEALKQFIDKTILDKARESDEANEWNKSHAEAHKKHCRDYDRRERNKARIRKYQREYYHRVTKPKREAERKEQLCISTK